MIAGVVISLIYTIFVLLGGIAGFAVIQGMKAND